MPGEEIGEVLALAGEDEVLMLVDEEGEVLAGKGEAELDDRVVGGVFFPMRAFLTLAFWTLFSTPRGRVFGVLGRAESGPDGMPIASA
jgi:hypothetical protein